MSKLILVRHGDNKLDGTGRYLGSSDVKLSADGLKQAERLRDCLAMQKIDAIYSSNLQRAMVTAETIASKHQLAVTTCAELREIDFGKLEGLTFDEAHQLYPEVTRLWVEKSSALQYPGGESLDEFYNRVSSFAGRLKKYAPEETILIVAHSGSLRLLICQFLGIELWHWRQFRLDFASLSILDTYPQGAILSLLNAVSHLA